MPDVWTRHPDIVRDLLKEGGFTCGVPPRMLKGRDPAWTCIIDGKTFRGDIYIHHAATFRGEAPAPSLVASMWPAAGLSLPDLLLPGLMLAVGVVVGRWAARGRR